MRLTRNVFPFILGLLLCSPLASQAAGPPAWTILGYMDCDCDLEAAQIEDLKEMLAAGSGPEVQVVVLCDRSPQGEESDGYSNEPVGGLKNWSTAKLLRLQNGKLQELADWGEVNMSDGSTLERFLREVPRQFPAQKTALFFGDHGASWPGACLDDSASEGDHLTPVEIAAALKNSGTPRLELVGFDCCLMGHLENWLLLSPYARYAIGSEELEPGSGWHYTPTLKRLLARPAMSGAELGKAICEEFQWSFDRAKDPDTRAEGQAITLSVVDLEALQAAQGAFSELAQACHQALQQGGRETWVKLARCRAHSEEYGKSGDPKEPGSAVHDLGHLCSLLTQEFAGAPLAQVAQRARQALLGCVVTTVHGPARKSASGLSVFFPPDLEVLQQPQPLTYAQTVGATPWLTFLQSFVGAGNLDHQGVQLATVQSTGKTLVLGQSLNLTSHVSGDDLDEAYFVLAQTSGQHVVFIGSLPSQPDASGTLHEQWNGDWLYLGSDNQSLLCPITEAEETEDGEYLVQIPTQVCLPRQNKWREVTFHVLIHEQQDGSLKGEVIYAMLEDGGAPRQIRLPAGTRLRPLYLTVDATGDESMEASEDPADTITLRSGKELDIFYDEVDPGDYLVGFLATDLAGNTTDETVPVTVVAPK
ncbi:MAG: clostripain-related cysteine peptidase [Vulcanimicrobiota bacterium]